jgi:hypothetical protein
MRVPIGGVVVFTATVMATALCSYYFGFAVGRGTFRGAEAAEDVLVPLDDVRRTRLRREGIREMLGELAAAQVAAHQPENPYLPIEDLSFDSDRYVVEGYHKQYLLPYGDKLEHAWIAVARDRTSPMGEVCAVALNFEPVYAAGIRLKRQGKVRCAWDMATRLNRILD